MITVNLSSNIAAVTKQLQDDFKRQVPFAASRAINELAFEARNYLKIEMGNYYDGGAVTYTKNSIYSTKSNKRNLVAKVYVGGNDQHRIRYVLNTIHGGTALPRKKALTEPISKSIRLTKVGNNIPKGYIDRALQKPGYFIHRQTTKKGKKQKTAMPSGLYKRKTKKAYPIQLIVKFDPSSQHKPVFPAMDLSETFVMKRFNKIFGKHLAQAIASRKPSN